MDDAEAIGRLRGGDIGGLEMLVRRYQLRAVAAAYLIARDRDLAEDMVQGAFLRVYERIAQFDPARPFAPWFLRCVVNDTLKAVERRERDLPLAAGQDGVEWTVDPGPEPAAMLEWAETAAAVRAAPDQLSAQQRAAVVLRYYLGLSEAEMAARLDCPVSTVKWRLHAARANLRRLLPAWLRAVEDDPVHPQMELQTGGNGKSVKGEPQ